MGKIVWPVHWYSRSIHWGYPPTPPLELTLTQPTPNHRPIPGEGRSVPRNLDWSDISQVQMSTDDGMIIKQGSHSQPVCPSLSLSLSVGLFFPLGTPWPVLFFSYLLYNICSGIPPRKYSVQNQTDKNNTELKNLPCSHQRQQSIHYFKLDKLESSTRSLTETDIDDLTYACLMCKYKIMIFTIRDVFLTQVIHRKVLGNEVSGVWETIKRTCARVSHLLWTMQNLQDVESHFFLERRRMPSYWNEIRKKYQSTLEEQLHKMSRSLLSYSFDKDHFSFGV